MKPEPASLGGGPAEVLTAAARRLGLEFDPLGLRERLARHASPQSLLALVQVAPELGLHARAFRSDPAGLEDVRLPAIVHLRDAASEEDAFALLVGREAGEFVLASPPASARRRLSPAEFAQLWTGVVVLLAPLEAGARAAVVKRRSLSSRTRERWAGAPGSGPLVAARSLGLAALVVLAAAGAVRLGLARDSPWLSAGALVGLALTGLGAFVSAALVQAGRRTQVASATPRLASLICGHGKLTDCEGVLASRYARIGGVDLASLGLAFFGSTLLLGAIAGVLAPGPSSDLVSWIAVAYLAAVPGSLALIALQIWPLRRFCPLCMAVHGSILGAAALGLAFLLAGGGSRDAWALAPYGLLHAALLPGALGLLVSHLELGLESRSHRTRLGWIGSTPWGALAELAGRPAVEPPAAPIRLGNPSARFQLDVLVHPFCSGCPPVIERLARLVERYPGALLVGFHVPPRDRASAADRELCAALSATGILAGGEQTLHVLRAVKQDPWPVLELAGAGADRVLARFLPADVSTAAALADARAAVRGAARLAESLGRGTPTLLVAGRVWDAPIEDLDALLARHADLLASVLELHAHELDARAAGERS